MVRTLCLVAALALGGIAPLHAQVAVDKHAALEKLFAEEWERGLSDSPENASYNGDVRYNDRWTDYSLAAIGRRAEADKSALQRLHAIGRDGLTPADQLNYDTFEWNLQQAVSRQRFHEELLPLSHQVGVQLADGMAEIVPFENTGDYRKWLSRMGGIDTWVEQILVLMQKGQAAGYMPPRVLMERVQGQIAAQIVDDPGKSPFYRAFQKFPDTISEADRAALQGDAKKLISNEIVPAYRKLQAYFVQTYLPASRDTIAISALPDGQDYYAALAAYYTTTPLTPKQIHALGLKEVARIRAEMENIKGQVSFKGDLPAFFDHLRSDPRFFYKTPEELFTAYQALSKRIDPELVKVFHTIPRLPYGVRPIPDNVAPDTTTAYYQPGAADGSRAGFYYVNLYKPESRPKWEMMALSLHEAVPGHHFQMSRGIELPDMPMFRKTAYFVAYGEGWGLYAERLGYDMGLYDDPYDRFGQLTYDMWRAVRLVVDTGMHSMGWSREQAIAYFKANAAKTDQDIVNEIDRYIAWPGQALAYKIGQLKISELREKAATTLGPKFDLRAFNDEVLNTGSVPLETLERHMDAWMAGQKGRDLPASH
ncbi:DUF885 domain-containing protein [Pseudoxanthomonas indica]|uniref:Uncharacterized conserved protein, DUF885 familyt n=1 Tax=Pseudoxanthomonas indica TaxID=428993 RepID=A0A1T5LZM7_9GAMM|nr:DUF885 domain-containing protein [Pseudoxanthomonas indica]GGD43007.1 hypothetical protein GCM10007235_13810 [Pseudoxanthomonas indica]SKC81427.1 Uncharacterized conserved protein, DUF885 familyt [Pseudoxanthomonas indica]